ncbi:MAG: transposase, partial [Lactococcus sp.]
RSFLMAKYSFELKLNAILADEKGSGDYQTKANKYHVNRLHLIKDWGDMYRSFGSSGLQCRSKNKVYDTQFKLNAVNLYLTSENLIKK